VYGLDPRLALSSSWQSPLGVRREMYEHGMRFSNMSETLTVRVRTDIMAMRSTTRPKPIVLTTLNMMSCEKSTLLSSNALEGLDGGCGSNCDDGGASSYAQSQRPHDSSLDLRRLPREAIDVLRNSSGDFCDAISVAASLIPCAAAAPGCCCVYKKKRVKNDAGHFIAFPPCHSGALQTANP